MRQKYRAKFGLWNGPKITHHDVSVSAKDDQDALRTGLKTAISATNPGVGKKTARHKLRSAIATVGRHYSVVPESTRSTLKSICCG